MKSAILVLLVLVLSGCTQGATLAMFDLEDKSGLFSPGQLEQIGDHIAAALGEGGKVKVVPRESLRGMCQAADLACRAAKAQEFKASGFLLGRILKPGELCSLVLSLYSKDGGKVLRSASISLECDPDALLAAADRAVRQLGPPWAPEGAADQEQHLQKYEEEMRQQAKKIMEQREELERLAMELKEREEALARREAEISEPAEPPPPIPLTGEEKGKLSINSTPWAKVYIDGRPVGNTPLANLELDPGEVELVLEGPQGRKVTRKVTIEPGKTIKMVVHLPDTPEE